MRCLLESQPGFARMPFQLTRTPHTHACMPIQENAHKYLLPSWAALSICTSTSRSTSMYVCVCVLCACTCVNEKYRTQEREREGERARSCTLSFPSGLSTSLYRCTDSHLQLTKLYMRTNMCSACVCVSVCMWCVCVCTTCAQV